ncbi:hypothetical protein KGP95_09410 [Burkholderia multivorans]|uniref:hypothetical protein n=1 Tax=Burkholderia multivorans TaxID=87883 RepID=UPI00209D61AC|nr:hypothetical protein [Burkholderia multivorans]MCO8609848.1 hypothetical protein [Burkholderia multivorans]MCO8637555.1 hypothetical protein [Burkholderia multivorans]MCO8649749.1 hypothetical protein [Burkholderia multivorans]
MSRHFIASLVAASCVLLAACQSASEPPAMTPSPETASTAVPAARIRGIGSAPRLAGQSHWSVSQCTSNGTVNVCQ